MSSVTEPTGTRTTPARRPRLRRWARRPAIALVTTLAVVTCASFGYNARTPIGHVLF